MEKRVAKSSSEASLVSLGDINGPRFYCRDLVFAPATRLQIKSNLPASCIYAGRCEMFSRTHLCVSLRARTDPTFLNLGPFLAARNTAFVKSVLLSRVLRECQITHHASFNVTETNFYCVPIDHSDNDARF